MSYADYEYYNNEYLLGKAALISAADFNYYEAKAAGKVDYYTFGRLKSSTDVPEEVKKCVCDIAEKLQEYDKAVKLEQISCSNAMLLAYLTDELTGPVRYQLQITAQYRIDN